MTNTWHPDELQLINAASDPGQDSQVVAHIQDCAACAADVEFLQEAVSRPPAPMWTEAISRDSPRAGDIWRVRWEDVATVVVIVSVADNNVDAAPVLAASAELDGWTPLPELGSSMGFLPVVVGLPHRVLDYCVGREEADQMAAAWIPVDDATIADAFDRHALEVSTVIDKMLALAEAEWVPTGAGQPVSEVLAEHFDKPSDLGAVLGVGAGEAARVLRGKRPLTAAELGTLVAHHPDFAATTPSVDADLAWAIDQPEVRPLWDSAAAASGVADSSEFRWATYSAGDFALAARTAGANTRRDRALRTVKGVLRGWS